MELAALVTLQGQMIDNIEENIKTAKNNVIKGEQNIIKAKKNMQSARKVFVFHKIEKMLYSFNCFGNFNCHIGTCSSNTTRKSLDNIIIIIFLKFIFRYYFTSIIKIAHNKE